MKKKIVAFAGSNSSKSINKQLVEFVLTYFDGFDKNLLDLNDFEMPIYSIDQELANKIPKEVALFQKQINDADVIICSLAEHNRTYTTAFKNILDWCSRSNSNVFSDKPMLLLSTSTGAYGGGNVMHVAKTFFPQFGAQIIETFSLPSFEQNFADKDIINKELKNELQLKINTFKEAIK